MQDWGERLMSHEPSVEKKEQSRFDTVLEFLQSRREWQDISIMQELNNALKEYGSALSIASGKIHYEFRENDVWQTDQGTVFTKHIIHSTKKLFEIYHGSRTFGSIKSALPYELQQEIERLWEELWETYAVEQINRHVAQSVWDILENEWKESQLSTFILWIQWEENREKFLLNYTSNYKYWDMLIWEKNFKTCKFINALGINETLKLLALWWEKILTFAIKLYSSTTYVVFWEDTLRKLTMVIQKKEELISWLGQTVDVFNKLLWFLHKTNEEDITYVIKNLGVNNLRDLLLKVQKVWNISHFIKTVWCGKVVDYITQKWVNRRLTFAIDQNAWRLPIHLL